ncbi:MAG: GNAT family N-acetyltransferase [Clostridiales bacterium]|nr:GNAT family N-acetyltransferase [Clostridiales bacterium]
METIVRYSDELKDRVFGFTDKCFREIGKVFEPEGRHYFYNNIEEEFDAFWCLLSEGEVVGTVAVKPFDKKSSELKALYLSQEMRGKGYGLRLLDMAVEFSEEKGYERIVLDSMSIYKDALKLYERYGFTHIERYNDNPYADIFMEYRFG